MPPISSNGKNHDRTADQASKRNDIAEIRNGWFTETETLWPGQKFSLALENFSAKSVLYHQRSNFQDILVFSSAQFGNVLVLDGVIQLTERDEFAYHETMVHVPLLALPRRAQKLRVLIVGGGDGGVLREVRKHAGQVEHVTLVEIDSTVTHVAETYFGAQFSSDESMTVDLQHADAAEFLRNEPAASYDIILADTSDPVGPAATLFEPAFYESMYRALRAGGCICVQAECFWIHLPLISDITTCCRDTLGFTSVEYASTMVPTYPCGQIGFLLASKGLSTLRFPRQAPPAGTKLRWYSPAVHEAAFCLPPFVRDTLYPDGDELDDNFRPSLGRDCFLGRFCPRSLVQRLSKPFVVVQEPALTASGVLEDGENR